MLHFFAGKHIVTRTTLLLSCLGIMFYFNSLLPIKRGIEQPVAIEPFVTFPASDNDNELGFFGAFSHGFALENNTTTCTLSTIFPITGLISLNGGMLYLQKDLLLSNTCSLDTGGTIIAQNHVIDLGNSINLICGKAYPLVLNDAKLLMHNDLDLSSNLIITGNQSRIDGNGKVLRLTNDAALILDTGVTLTLKNMVISGVNGNNIRCSDDTARLVLDNVSWHQSGNYTFSHGSLEIAGASEFVGSHIFSFQTTMTSTIRAESCLLCDVGFTFSYDPLSGSPTLLHFEDKTSVLKLRGATFFTTSKGVRFTQGCLIVSGFSSLVSEPTDYIVTIDELNGINSFYRQNNGFSFGASQSEADFVCHIKKASQLSVFNCPLVYRNVNRLSWYGENNNTVLKMEQGSSLILDQELNLGNVLGFFSNDSQVVRMRDVQLKGRILTEGTLDLAKIY